MNGAVEFVPLNALLDFDLAAMRRLSKKPRMLFFWLGAPAAYPGPLAYLADP